MNRKNNLVRVKVEFEHSPIFDSTKNIKSEDEFDDMIGELKIKLFGK